MTNEEKLQNLARLQELYNSRKEVNKSIDEINAVTNVQVTRTANTIDIRIAYSPLYSVKKIDALEDVINICKMYKKRDAIDQEIADLQNKLGLIL